MGRNRRVRPNVRSLSHLKTPGLVNQTVLNRRLYNEIERRIEEDHTWRVQQRQLEEFAGWLVYGEDRMPDVLDGNMARAVRESLLSLLKELGWPEGGLREELEERLGLLAGSRNVEAKATETPSNSSFNSLYAEVDEMIRRRGWGDVQSQLARDYIRSLAEGKGSRDQNMKLPVQIAVVRAFYKFCVSLSLPVSTNLEKAITETFCKHLQDMVRKAGYKNEWTDDAKARALSYGLLLAKDGRTKSPGPVKPSSLPTLVAEKVEQLFGLCYLDLEDLLQGRSPLPGQYCLWFLASFEEARNAQRR